MKKLEVIALLLSAIVEISSGVSIYTAISDSEHVASDNRIPKKLQPVELMTDATNHLGFTILDLHSKLNKNNIAFSPCGLMSVLVALYEGTGGRSGIELKEALEFPLERDIVRIGVRDIHRRLRSYFYKRENLLSGLIFNKENITIRQEYETVLRFYGYDLDGTSNMLTESRVDGEDGGGVTNSTTTEATESSSTPMSETTITSSDDDDAATATEEASDDDATTIAPGEASGADDDDSGGEETTVAPTRKKRRGRLGRGLKSKQQQQQQQRYNGSRDRKPSLATVLVRNPTINRRSRSYYVLLDDDYENGFNFEVASPTPIASVSSTHHHHHHHHHYETSKAENSISTTTPITTTTTVQSNGPNNDGKYRNNNHKELFENVNSDTVEHIFYLNEYETVRVPYKLYDTVMKYAYVNPLQASFLEIDLDSEYYNLIIIVPDRIDGLTGLAEKLQSSHANSLRHIRNSMEYYWVKTIVPKFNLKGNSILTGDLQNMGINDIFEPTKADFSLMAEDKSLYVKNIEQMININIRTQSTQQLKKISSLYKRPIEVPVNIPFIYCVVDKKLDLTIILGRILNPLNSRIQ